MILEGLITTLDESGGANIAPMGPDIGNDFEQFDLKPFPSSNTYRNLKRHGEGVFHITDDVLLLARAAIGDVTDEVIFPARHVEGWVIQNACRYLEFRVIKCDESELRAKFSVEIVHQETLRNFFGFNRAKHAVLEAAILATRASFLPLESMAEEFVKIKEIVLKTGGNAEKEAFQLLKTKILQQARLREVALEHIDL